MQDLESALHYSFRQEIAICKMIDGDKLDALKNFVTALAKVGYCDRVCVFALD